MTDRKSGINTGRDPRGRFAAGNRGKPKGTKHRATRIALELFESGVQSIAATVIEQAQAGDLAAARIVIDKLIPSAKERHVDLPNLPDMTTATGVSEAQQRVIDAVAAGVLTPGEANTLSGIIERRRKAIETQEIEARIAALEDHLRETP